MKFVDFSLLCDILKNNSKRLIKVQILRDFFIQYDDEEVMIAFDLLSGNFAREISKKEVGISTQTTFQVLSEYFEVSSKQIQRAFSNSGDIFKVVDDFTITQKVLQETQGLTLRDVVETMRVISQISGSNAQTKKKNKLLFLFSKTTTTIERQVLSAYLADLLKIGVNEGVLHDAFVFSYFPKIEILHFYSENLRRFLISKDIEYEYSQIIKGSSLDIVKYEEQYEDYEHLEYTSFEELCDFSFPMNYYLISNSQDESNSRDIAKEFRNHVERVYSFNVSYRTSFSLLSESLKNMIKPPIVHGKALQVMLGPRLYSFDEVEERIEFPVFSDYKYDGLRLIIQNRYGDVKLFSRNLEDLTTQFSEIVTFVQDNFSHISCVLDGECIGFDTNSYEQVEFQQLSKRIMTKSHNLKVNIIIGLRLFDILELEGEQIHTHPLKTRQEKLRKLFRRDEGVEIDKKFSSQYVKEKLKEYFKE